MITEAPSCRCVKDGQRKEEAHAAEQGCYLFSDPPALPRLHRQASIRHPRFEAPLSFRDGGQLRVRTDFTRAVKSSNKYLGIAH